MICRSVVGLIGFAALLPTCFAQYAVHVSRSIPVPHAFSVSGDMASVLDNSTILVGHTNTSTHAVGNGSNDTTVSTKLISPLGGAQTTVQVDVNTQEEFIGVRFNGSDSDSFYGVWEYPFDNSIKSDGIMFDLKGVGNSAGINWSNARSPFFISSSGYGVFADTETMGSFDFTTPGDAQFIFNTSSLTYYVIFPEEGGSVKSILEQYVSGLSDPITMPPDTGYGPMFWNDDWTQQFEGNTTNSQDSILDVVDHLYSNQIRALAIMADRPYGTGSDGWGNFDFDPEFFPSPEEFIANLTSSGLDFQVWVANRAYAGSVLYEDAEENGWLFHTIADEDGPALNLSIPEAYDALKEYMRFFPDIGVKGFKIDRGEEGEMPGMSN
jgi:alpha-D-xyloside xylohydrolase